MLPQIAGYQQRLMWTAAIARVESLAVM